MRIGARSIGLFSCVIASLIAASAYPNGRQPPRLSDTSPVKATCEERSGGKRHEILRARIAAGDESTERLNVLIDNASERVAIADIKTLTLPSARVDLDGYMKATLVRGDDSEQRSVMVEVRSGKANLRLAGFANDSTGVSVDLSRCKKIEFSSGALSGADSGDLPAAKK